MTADLVTCEVPDCDARRYARQMCRKHYDVWRAATPKTERPTPAPRMPAFDDCYTKAPDNGCWVWDPRRRNATNYGVYSKHLAHRMSWQRANGEIPAGLEVCHRCDNPPCVNPDHLYVGTHAQNMKDMSDRGRVYIPPQKTHCDYGHEMVGDNILTYVTSAGNTRRNCATCMRGHHRNYRKRETVKRDTARPPAPAGTISRSRAVAEYAVSSRTLAKYVTIGKLSHPTIYYRESHFIRAELERLFAKRADDQQRHRPRAGRPGFDPSWLD